MAMKADVVDAPTDAALLELVHVLALRAPIFEAAAALRAVLARPLAAYVVGVKDVKTISRWAAGSVSGLRAEHEARLRAAYEIIALLERFEAPDTVRAWFIGMCPQLEDVSPARAIHDGRLTEALHAARTFATYG